MESVVNGLLQEVATDKNQTVVLGEVVQVEWSPHLEQSILDRVVRIEAWGLTVDEECVTVLSLARRCERLVYHEGVPVVRNTEGLSISNGPVVEVHLRAWGTVEGNIRIDQEENILRRLWVVVLLAGEGESGRRQSLGRREVCAQVDLLGSIGNIDLNLWCPEGWCLDQVWDNPVRFELADNELGVRRADGAAFAAGAVIAWGSKGKGREGEARKECREMHFADLNECGELKVRIK